MEGIEVRLLKGDSLKYKYADIPKYVFDEETKFTEYTNFIAELKNVSLHDYFLEDLEIQSRFGYSYADISIIGFIEAKNIKVNKEFISFYNCIAGLRPVLKFDDDKWPFSPNIEENVIVEYGIYPKQMVKVDCSNFNDEKTGEEFEFNYEVDKFFDEGKTPIYAKKDDKGNIKYRYIKAINNNYIVILEPVKWITAKDNTLISKDVIDLYHFSNETSNSFNKSNFYKWLNTTFINNLTISKEKSIKVTPNGKTHINVTLLTKSELSNPFSLVRKYDSKHKMEYNIIDCKDDIKLKANYLLCSNINYQYTYDCDEKKILQHFKVKNCGNYVGIRPVLEFNKEDFPFSDKNNGDTVYYGTYPSGDWTLKDLPLIDTHKTIMFRRDGCAPIYEDMNTGIEYVRAYEYNKNYTNYQIKPIKWIVDKNNNRLISCAVIDFIVPFYGDYHLNFKDTEKYKWLNSFFLSSLQLENYEFSKEEEQEEKVKVTEKEDEVKTILKEINKYLEYYQGKENIKEKVNNLIKEYNDSLKNLIIDNKMANTTDAKSLYTNLILNLEMYLAKLKAYSSKTKNYYDMLNIIKNCRKEEIDTSVDELCELVNTIKTKILPFIDDEATSLKLDEFLLEEQSIIEQKIMDTNDDSNTPTLDELKMEFRKNIHPYLISISRNVVNKDNLLTLKEEITNGISNVYEDSNNSLITMYLKQLKELETEIRNKANYEELEDLSILLNYDVSNENSVIAIASNLKKQYISMYRLLLSINNRLFIESELNKYLIDYNLDSIDSFVLEKSI